MLRRRKIAAGLFMSLVAGLFSLTTPQAPVSAIGGGTGGWSAIGFGIGNGTVFSLAPAPDGMIYAGGTFTGGVAAWNPATSAWSVLGGGVGGSASNPTADPNVYDVELDTSVTPSQLYVGGSFTTVGGSTTSHGLARVNTSTGAWTAIGGINVGTAS